MGTRTASELAGGCARTVPITGPTDTVNKSLHPPSSNPINRQPSGDVGPLPLGHKNNIQIVYIHLRRAECRDFENSIADWVGCGQHKMMTKKRTAFGGGKI